MEKNLHGEGGLTCRVSKKKPWGSRNEKESIRGRRGRGKVRERQKKTAGGVSGARAIK